jgi:hypothetical protein
MNGPSFKQIARDVADHHKSGGCVVPFYGEQLEGASAVVILGEPFEVPSQDITPKDVKRFLWERRHLRAAQRKSGVVVTVQRENSSLMMLGALVTRRTRLFLSGRESPVLPLEEHDAS